jgi:GNAT superfamily N-acetyltransferase
MNSKTEVVKIKQARNEDIPLILTFIKEIAAYEKLSDEVVTSEDTLKESLFGKSSCAEVILSYLNNQPVAFAVYFHNFSTFTGKKGLYLEDIFVRPAYRGHGVGMQMLKYLAKLAIERDCGRMEWSVLNWNEPAINFYNKIGAVPMQEWTVYRMNEDAIRNFADL